MWKPGEISPTCVVLDSTTYNAEANYLRLLVYLMVLHVTPVSSTPYACSVTSPLQMILIEFVLLTFRTLLRPTGISGLYTCFVLD